MIYLGYVRVSTEEQGKEGFSVEAQESKILEGVNTHFTKGGSYHTHDVRFTNDIGCSGSIPLKDRFGGKQLLAFINRFKKESLITVVTTKLDRLFRDASDALETTKEWNKLGINLVILDFGGESFNSSTPMGRMFLTMMAGFAELERNMIAERTKNVLEYKKKEKLVYSKVPYGWLVVDSRLVKYEEEQRVIKLMRTLKEENGYNEIANILNKEGVKTKEGKDWHGSTVRYIMLNDLNKED